MTNSMGDGGADDVMNTAGDLDASATDADITGNTAMNDADTSTGDESGSATIIAIDADGDAVADLVMVDVDGDGEVDLVMTDTDAVVFVDAADVDGSGDDAGSTSAGTSSGAATSTPSGEATTTDAETTGGTALSDTPGGGVALGDVPYSSSANAEGTTDDLAGAPQTGGAGGTSSMSVSPGTSDSSGS